VFSVREIAAIVRGDLTLDVGGEPRHIVHDSRRTDRGDLFVALRGARANGHAFLAEAFERGACAALVSEHASDTPTALPLIVVPDTPVALQRLAGAWRDRLDGKTIVAITGSNGKTTTRSLLAHILRGRFDVHEAPENYNTEIGLPLALLGMAESSEIGVFELGTEKPGEIAALTSILRPTIGILTGVGPSHLGGFGSIDAIAREKWDLARGLPLESLLLVNGDAGPFRPFVANEKLDAVTVGLAAGQVRGRVVEAIPMLLVEVDDPPLRLETQLVGEHNATNVLLAALCAHRLGLASSAIEARMRTFEAFPHRLKPLPAPFGVILDDVYNANPASMKAALHVLTGYGGPSSRRVFVFGDMLDLGETSDRHHREILKLALELGIDSVLPAGPRAADACLGIKSARIALAEPEGCLAQLRTLLTGPSDVVLIKGSRALRLEELVDGLLALS